MSLISVDKVSFGYTSERRILDCVSLDIAAGDTVGLVGESGSGKTTLLRLLLGLAKPDSGNITFGSTTVAFERTLDSIRLTINNNLDGTVTEIVVPQLLSSKSG